MSVMSRIVCYALVTCSFALLVPNATLAAPQAAIQFALLTQQGRVDEALKVGDELLAMGPSEAGLSSAQFVDLLLAIAGANRQAKRYEHAVVICSKALQIVEADPLDPKSLTIFFLIADIEVDNGNRDRAREAAETALARSRSIYGPTNPATRFALLKLADVSPPNEALKLRAQAETLQRDDDLRDQDIHVLGGPNGEADACNNKSPQQAGFERIRIFYATDRARTGSAIPTEFYGADDGALSYGITTVSVPCRRQLGDIPTQSYWAFEFRPDPNKHFVLESIRPSTSEADFISGLRSKLGSSKRKEALLFIHGFNNSFEDAAFRTAQLAADLELDGAPILYSWPSRGDFTSYVRDRARVIAPHVSALEHVLQIVAQQSGAERIHVVAHSLGNDFLLQALGLLAQSGSPQFKNAAFDDVIFASPDVAKPDFEARFPSIAHLARKMTLYGSTQDTALWFSEMIQEYPRAGNASERVVLPGLDTVDTTAASGGLIGHDDFAGTALNDFQAVVWLSLIPKQRCILEPRAAAGRQFWAFGQRGCSAPTFMTAITMMRRLIKRETVHAWLEKQIELATAAGMHTDAAHWADVERLVDSWAP